jgi:hypothetical protein
LPRTLANRLPAKKDSTGFIPKRSMKQIGDKSRRLLFNFENKVQIENTEEYNLNPRAKQPLLQQTP